MTSIVSPNGNVAGATPASFSTGYGYDAADPFAYSDGVTQNVAFTYSRDGQRAKMADGTGTNCYNYVDVLGT